MKIILIIGFIFFQSTSHALLLVESHTKYEVINLSTTVLEVKNPNIKSKATTKQSLIKLDRKKADPQSKLRPYQTITLTDSMLNEMLIR